MACLWRNVRLIFSGKNFQKKISEPFRAVNQLHACFFIEDFRYSKEISIESKKISFTHFQCNQMLPTSFHAVCAVNSHFLWRANTNSMGSIM